MTKLFLCLLVILNLASSRYEVNKLFTDDSGTLYSMQAISDKEKPFMEAIAGCSMKCAEMCYRLSSGSELIKCAEMCGCRELIKKVELVGSEEEFSAKSVYSGIDYFENNNY